MFFCYRHPNITVCGSLFCPLLWNLITQSVDQQQSNSNKTDKLNTITTKKQFCFLVLNTADVRAVGFRECLNEVTSYLHNFQDPNYKDEHKGQLLTNLNAIISHCPNGSPHVLSPPAQTMWPHPRGLGTSSETTRYNRTLPLYNTIKQQNLIREKSATMHITGVTLAPEHSPKQIASHCAIFPIDTTMQIVQFPFVPR